MIMPGYRIVNSCQNCKHGLLVENLQDIYFCIRGGKMPEFTEGYGKTMEEEEKAYGEYLNWCGEHMVSCNGKCRYYKK